ncbi:MAG: SDR family NAD(P)-dependent oxidoreductase [Planctomycetota bacterium]
MTASPDNELSPNKLALLKIRELKELLAEAKSSTSEPIAIVSMACRFPRRSRTPEEFWQCLIEQTDEVSEVPDDRWDLDAFYDEDPEFPGKMYARKGVFLDNLDLMDPEFFGISPREATWVDPQQRLLMEVGWEALERAGWQPERIGENTGIFVGWMHNDYQNEASDSFLNLNPYIATGAAGSFLCGRLAYYLGLQGPSLAVDTACSSSLVALHLACQSLQRGDCERALVGGVNAIVSPTTNILTCKLKALSPSGHSRAFDAAADGYLRGEGCGVVTLRKLSDAERDGDPILGIIRGSAIGHNGTSSGLTAPNPKAQEKVIRQALERAGVEPADVAYLEAHGTGTELGDPIEMQAAAAALAQDRATDNPLLVGSVKTNIGHLEAAAGMAGLMKVLLSIDHEQIPAQLNFDEPNPHIPWGSLAVKVLDEAVDWPQNDKQRIAGVSAFGMSGTNAHVVIEAPKKVPDVKKADHFESSPEVILLSTKSEEALQELATGYANQLRSDPTIDLGDFAYTTCVGRSHLDQRGAIVAVDRTDAIEKLDTLARLGNADGVSQGNGRRTPKVAWQFTGQGSQFVGMARGLYDSQPTFRDAIDRCESLLQQRRSQPLTEVLFEHADQINHTSWTQPCIFAVQMGLAKLLQSWGLQPDAVLGHSVGQYAAACVAGIMSWDDGLHLISERGRLIGELPPGGNMLAVFAPLDKVQVALDADESLSLAALNGSHIVVSGPESAVLRAEQHFAEHRVRTKVLTTSHAFHSSLMDPALAPFAAVADGVPFQRAQLPLVCNVSGKALAPDAKLNGEYWANHIRQAVQFSPSIEEIQSLGCEVIVELGPQAILTRMAAANWKQPTNQLISCLQKGGDDRRSLLEAIGQLYVHGSKPEFDKIYAEQSRRRVVLPTYPFQRRRFWGPDKPRAAHAEFHTAHPLLGSKVALAGVTGETRYESFVEPDSPPWLPDHEVMGQIVMPGAAYVEMALAAAGTASVRDVVFEQPLRPTSRTALQSVVRQGDEGTQSMEVFSSPAGDSQWTRNFTCSIAPTEKQPAATIDRASIESKCTETAEPAEFYQKMQATGLSYGPKFQTIDSIRYTEQEVLTHLSVNGDIRGFTLPPTLLDGALHSLAIGLLRDDDENLYLPVGIGRVDVSLSIESEAWCHARWKQSEGKLRTADITIFTDTGQVAAEIQDLQVQQISRSALRQLSGIGAERLLHEINWQSFRLPAATTSKTKWLLVRSDTTSAALAEQVTSQLVNQDHRVINVTFKAGEDFLSASETDVSLDPTEAAHWEQLFDSLSVNDTFSPDGIAWLAGGDSSSAAGEIPQQTHANCAGVLNLLHTLGKREIRSLACGLQLVTTDAIAATADESVNPQQTQYWGLGRVLGAEQPELRCRVIDLDHGEIGSDETAIALTDILLTETADNQLLIRNQQFSVPRLKVATVPRKLDGGININPEASYLITGGLGKLGRQAAKWLAEKGAQQVVLVSRREPDEVAQAFLDEIRQLGCEVVVHAASLGSQTDVETLMGRFGSDCRPLAGVIHAAGVLDDGLIGDQNWERFEKVLAPKIVGAALLHEFTRELPLDFFILYSSAASVLGSPGQSNYATANAYLDGLAWQRRAMGLPALSINWGPWTEGMADDERIIKRLALQGITPLTVAEAHEAMEKMLAANLVQTTVMDVDWQRMRMGLGGEGAGLLADLAASKQRSSAGDSELVGKLKRLRGAAQTELLVSTLQNTLQQILSTSDLPETDRPLIEMGLDSLMAVEFGTELQLLLGDQFGITPTMLFDHPTIDAISEYVLELLAGETESEGTTSALPAKPTGEVVATSREDVAIVGMSCRFPGARNIDEFWHNLMHRVDSVREIPDDRWDIDRFFSADREPGKMYTREGGFLDDIADFDAAFFNISDQEACWIDPQHRMLLENSYRALEDAGIATQPLADSNVGVFMGIMGQDYAFLPSLDDEEIIRGFQGAGLSHSAGVGRISYMFGFEGPSIAVDTASSSSLVALVQAMRSLQDGNCNMALAGGVNAILAPVNSLLMSKAQLLSPDGRCKSFSAEANGFGRGEGCGVVVLKRLSDAQRDGDRIMAVVRGGAVVHNGFSGGITSPSGKSQARVIGDALKDAGIAPSQVQYLEAHGTGTEFGDPMELGAAASVYGKGRKPDEPLLVGSVKANISHLEAAGGVSGLIKTVLSLHHGVIPPQMHFDEPSPHIPWNRLPVKMVDQPTAWPDSPERVAGVTALGLVGTNAHVILSSNPQTTATPANADENSAAHPERPTQLLVFSARSAKAVSELASGYHASLSQHEDINLANVCATLAVGRRHYEYRVAITANSRQQLLEQLSTLAVNSDSSRTVQRFDSAHANGSPHFNGAQDAPATTFYSDEPGLAMNLSKSPPKVAWLFDEGAGDPSASARELYRSEPSFRQLITSMDERLSKHAQSSGQNIESLRKWLEGEEPLAVSDLHRFALQSGLANVWDSWGIQPDRLLGLGLGQYAATCAAGGLCWLEASTLIVDRQDIVNRIGTLRDQLGRLPSSDELPSDLVDELDRFEKFADTINYYPPSTPLICSVDAAEVPVFRSLGGSYWREHCFKPTKQSESLELLREDGCDFVLGLGQDDFSVDVGVDNWISTLSTDRDASVTMQDTLGRLYVAGAAPDFQAMHAHWPRQRLSMPVYPFQKKRYWITEISDHMQETAETVQS